LEEHERGRETRAFGQVVAALGAVAHRVDPVRPGVCALPTRGPSRYFGGDEALARLVLQAVAAVGGSDDTDPLGAIGVGIADGLFAAVLCARSAVAANAAIVPPGQSPAFLARWPVDALDRPELADLLRRLGIRTLGRFAALPGAQVLARFGADGVACHRVAGGTEGELPGFRLASSRTASTPPGGPDAPVRQPGFWGGTAEADARAARAVAHVQGLLHAEAVVRGRLQGGRGPSERARLIPWGGPGCDGAGPGAPRAGTRGDHRRGGRDARHPGGPWPGRVPPPAPVVVLTRPLPAVLVDVGGHSVGVTGAGMLTAAPARLSVGGQAWATVTAWAGPWPSDERWWSTRGRRRQARMQVLTTGGGAHLLTREGGGWWLEGVYD